MKKTSKLALISLLAAISLTACGGSESSKPSSTPTNNTGNSQTPSKPSTPSTPAPKPSYAITVTEGEGYKVEGLPETAKEGETVTFTLTLDQGKEADSVKAGDVDCTLNDDGSYSFTMPGEAVNVAVTVKNKKFKINSIYFDSGMSYYNPTLSFNVGDEFEFGQKVDFTLSATNSNFYASTLGREAIYINDEVIDLGSLGLSNQVTTVDNLSFTMPAKDVDIYVMPKAVDMTSGDADKRINKIVIDEAPSEIKVFSSEKFLYDSTYNYVFNSLYVARTDSYIVTKVSYKADNVSEWTELALSMTWTDNISYISLSNLNRGTVTGDLHLKIEGKKVASHKLTIVNGDVVTFTKQPAATYVEGDPVSLSFTGVDADKVIKYDIQGAENTAYSTDTNIQFNMPGNDVTITFSATDKGKITFETVEGVESAVAKDSAYSYYANEITSAYPGAILYVYATPKAGYTITAAYINGDKEHKVTMGNYDTCFKLTMPESGDALIGFEVEKNGSINIENTVGKDETITEVKYYSSSYASSTSEKTYNGFGANADVYMFVKVKDGYSLGDATITNNGTKITCKLTNSYNGSYYNFKMPSDGSDVSININVIQNGTITVQVDSTYVESTSLSKSNYSSDNLANNAIGAGETFYVFVKMKEDVSGYSLGQAQIQGKDDTAVDVQENYGNTYYQFTMPSDGSDVTIVISMVKNGNITIAENAGVSESKISTGASWLQDASKTDDFAPGKKFYILAKPVDGKLVTKASMSDGTEFKATEVEATYNYGDGFSYFKFTMPKTGVANISFTTADAKKVTFDTVDGLTFSFPSGATSGTSFAVGEKVQVMATASYGYTVKSLAIKDHADVQVDKKTDDNGNTYYEFIMPDYDVTLTGSVEASQVVTISVLGTKMPSKAYAVTINVNGVSSAPSYSYYDSGKTDVSITWIVGDSLSFTYTTSDYRTDDDMYVVITKTDGSVKEVQMSGGSFNYSATATLEADWASIYFSVGSTLTTK